MNKLETRELIRMCIEIENREQLLYFKSLNPRRGHYNNEQKEYAIEKAKRIGIRATSRLLHIPRRTIQRWCIIRSKVATDSDSFQPLIPVESSHRFRSKIAAFIRIPEFKITEATLDNFNVVSHHNSSTKERRMRWQERGYLCVKSKRYYA